MQVCHFLVLLTLFQVISAETSCYFVDFDKSVKRCFSNDAPFDGMPVPEDAQAIMPKYFIANNTASKITWTLLSDKWRSDASKHLYVVTHGFTGNIQNTAWLEPLIESLFRGSPESQIVFVEWEAGAKMGRGLHFYSQPASNTRVIGAMIAHWVNVAKNKDFKNVDCVGFSLGGQVCGFFGKEVTAYFSKTLGRIRALDPAGPCFDSDSPMVRLDKTDAAYVDAIHTSWFGLHRDIAHADFWANGANNQPGCSPLEGWLSGDAVSIQSKICRGTIPVSYLVPDQAAALPYAGRFSFSCAHERAAFLFAESTQPTCLPPWKPDSNNKANKFLFCLGGKNNCSVSDANIVGFYAMENPKFGKFSGNTSAKEPYCL